MTTFIILAITHTLFLIGGIYIGIKNASSSKVEKAKSLLDEITGK